MHQDNAAPLVILAWVAFAILALAGWVMNIIAIFGELGDPVTTLFIARLFGILVVPFGALLGWFA